MKSQKGCGAVAWVSRVVAEVRIVAGVVKTVAAGV
jgi:hypothetical protein